MKDRQAIENIIYDILIDYGGLDASGTYTSGQYELLVQALANELKAKDGLKK